METWSRPLAERGDANSAGVLEQNRHERKKDERNEVGGAGNRIPAGDVLRNGLTSKQARGRKFRCHYQSQREKTDEKANGCGRWQREKANHVAGRQDDGDEHERQFKKLGTAHTHAGSKEQHSHRAQQKARTKHERKVQKACLQDAHDFGQLAGV